MDSINELNMALPDLDIESNISYQVSDSKPKTVFLKASKRGMKMTTSLSTPFTQDMAASFDGVLTGPKYSFVFGGIYGPHKVSGIFFKCSQ